MIEKYEKPLLDIIDTIIGGVDTYQAVLNIGELIVIANNGIAYMMSVADMFPQDLSVTISYRKTTTGSICNIGYDQEFASQTLSRTVPLSFQGSEVVLYYTEDFAKNETFEEMRNGRAKDGQFKFILDSNYGGKIIFILHKGIFNLAKADKITLTVYDKSFLYNAPNGTYLMFSYHITKKKLNKEYDISYLALNLWRNIHDITAQ